MNGTMEIRRVATGIAELFSPEKIILYSKKINFETDDVKSFSLCVILTAQDTLRAEQAIYLKVESALPFDVLVYTPEQWQKLISNKYSFACNTIQKGNVLYEKK